jgi:trans-aconitate 2-methyltransferase
VPARESEAASATTWDPARYRLFHEERLRPARELLQRIPLERAERIADLGCGEGRATRLCAERFPGASVEALDRSSEMLARARAEAGAPELEGRIRWVEGAIEGWTPAEPVDLVFANASLHWVAGHRELVPRLLGFLRGGGCLALQVPLSFRAPSHRLLRETLADGGGAGRALGSPALRSALASSPVLELGEYFELCAPLASSVDAWETEYLHLLGGEDPVLAWVEGTALRPVLAGLAADERAAFLAEYRRRLRAAYPPSPADPLGRTPFPFRRMFLVARR